MQTQALATTNSSVSLMAPALLSHWSHGSHPEAEIARLTAADAVMDRRPISQLKGAQE
jgi:hypothetical protein